MKKKLIFIAFMLSITILVSTASAASITITSPTTGANWELGSDQIITWSFSGVSSSGYVRISLYKGGSLVGDIFQQQIPIGGSNGIGSKTWRIPSNEQTLPPGNDYEIGIIYECPSYPCDLITDVSGYFTLSTPPSITVSSPNGGENWELGSTHTISWDFAGISSADNVRIYLYNGDSFVGDIFQQNIPIGGSNGIGSKSWNIPSDEPTLPAGSDYRIQVRRVCPAGICVLIAGMSGYFTLSNPPSITVTSPNAGEIWYKETPQTITWTSTGDVGSNVKIDLYKAMIWVGTISSSTPNDGSFSWIFPLSQTTGTDYQICIQSTSNPSVYDYSSIFTIAVPPSINVTSPDSGEIWERDMTHEITWTSTGDVGSNVKIDLYKAMIWVGTISSSTPNDGSFSWIIPLSQTTGTD